MTSRILIQIRRPAARDQMEAKRRKFDPHITWAGNYCKHCYTCINICPVKNLKFDRDEMASLHKCIQCQLCEKYCPDFALEVEPKQASAGKARSAVQKSKPSTKEAGKAEAGEGKTAPSSKAGSKAEARPKKTKPRAKA
jgi:2-oxoglutarate ferredoxin oxidoreductase subunit delta